MKKARANIEPFNLHLQVLVYVDLKTELVRNPLDILWSGISDGDFGGALVPVLSFTFSMISISTFMIKWIFRGTALGVMKTERGIGRSSAYDAVGMVDKHGVSATSSAMDEIELQQDEGTDEIGRSDTTEWIKSDRVAMGHNTRRADGDEIDIEGDDGTTNI